MTQESKERFLNHLAEAGKDPARVVLSGENTVTEILQTAYSSFIDQSIHSSLEGNEFKEIVVRAAEICKQAKVPVIRGEFINFLMTKEKETNT